MNITSIRRRYRMPLKNKLQKLTGCRVQYAGFPCGTCFFSINTKTPLDNKDWQMVLWIRGDYKKKDLENLPHISEFEQRIKNILQGE